jgi:Na+-driven multidrug efflux pump
MLLGFKGGLMQAWWGMTAYVFLLAAGLWWRFRRGRWKGIRMI